MAQNGKTDAERRRLQGELKSLLDNAETIRSAAEKAGAWDAATAASYEQTLGKADGVKLALGLLGREEELRDYAHSSAGAATVAGTYGAEDMRPAGPTEGATGEAVIHQDWKSGELVAENAAGERKIAALKSTAYRDAFARSIRAKGLALLGYNPERFAVKGDAMKVLNEGTDTAGGLWVVPEFNATLVKKLPTMAAFAPAATHITVGTDLVSFPKVSYSTDDKYTSGVRYSWTGEAPSSDISEATNPTSARPEIAIYTATAALIMTRANLEDGQFDIIGLCSQLLSEAFILGNEDVIANGNGVGKPQGFLAHPNATTAHSSGGMYVPSGVAGALDWGIGTNAATKGLTGVEAALPPQYESGAAWYGAKATYAGVRALVDGAGRPIWGAGDSYPNMGNGMQANLLGYPVRKSQFMPAIGSNTYPLAFGDMAGYWIADRVGVTVEVLRELRALKDEVIIYARMRWGGKLLRDWSLKTIKCAVS